MGRTIDTSITCEILPATAPLEDIEVFLENSRTPYKFALDSAAHDAKSPILGIMYPEGDESYSPTRSFVRKDSYFVRVAGILKPAPQDKRALELLGVDLSLLD